MTWSLVGWVIIGFAAAMLLGFSFLFKERIGYPLRRFPCVERLADSRVAALEQGKQRAVVIGQRLWSHAYPGLGLQALSVLHPLLDAENLVEGGQMIAVGDGSLLLFARQIAAGRYRDGFSTSLNTSEAGVVLHGITPLSFTAGLLPELKSNPYGSLALFGDYGPETALWVQAATDKQERIFAAAGSFSSQAVLFPVVQDALIGEEVFMLPGLSEPDTADRGAFLTEDILRAGCILLLVVGGILKLAGIL